MVAKNLAVLVPAVMWKVENVPNELGDTVKEISNRVLKVPSFFFLLFLIVKLQEEREKLKAEAVSKKEPGLAVFED